MSKSSGGRNKSSDKKECQAHVADSTDDDIAAFRRMFAVLANTPESELGDHQVTYFSERDTREFLEGLHNPPPPTEAMVEAFRVYRSRVANAR